MKNLFIIISLLITTQIFAQNNLEFERVYNLQGAVVELTTEDIATVPTGKIWKIEALVLDANLFWRSTNNAIIAGSGQNNISVTAAYTSSGIAYQNIVWLNEGESIKLINSSSSSGTGRYWFSILEFNVIP